MCKHISFVVFDFPSCLVSGQKSQNPDKLPPGINCSNDDMCHHDNSTSLRKCNERGRKTGEYKKVIRKKELVLLGLISYI